MRVNVLIGSVYTLKDGTRHVDAGYEIELPVDVARTLVERGFVEALDPFPVEAEVIPPVVEDKPKKGK